MPDDGAPPRKKFATKRKRKPKKWSPVKQEPSDSDTYQAMGRTNPWRLSGFGSHDTIAWLPRPYLPWP